MIRRVVVAAVAAALPVVSAGLLLRRATDRLLNAPRVGPGEAALGPALDLLGGEVVRLRARDGLRLSGRWLPAEDAGGPPPEGEAGWRPDPREAILLLHGYTGSVAPDLVEIGPFLRRTAGVLGLDFRGHGDSDPSPTTFGLREVDDVAGALAWLGERGIRRVCLVGRSMGGITAIASVVVLGDGSLRGPDSEPDRPAAPPAPVRPRILGVVADSVAAELPTVVASRLPGPFREVVAARLFAAVARRLGGDPRATEPIRIVHLVAPVPLLLIHGTADSTVPLAEGRRLAAAAGPFAEHWEVDGADHGKARRTAPAAYAARVTAFARRAFAGAREPAAILAAIPGDPNDARQGG